VESAAGKTDHWEHGRRNFELREARILAIVCPLGGDSNLRGLESSMPTAMRRRRYMMDDPAVKAKVLTFEVFPCHGFPGDAPS
jgi:hypothetical protein